MSSVPQYYFRCNLESAFKIPYPSKAWTTMSLDQMGNLRLSLGTECSFNASADVIYGPKPSAEPGMSFCQLNIQDSSHKTRLYPIAWEGEDMKIIPERCITNRSFLWGSWGVRRGHCQEGAVWMYSSQPALIKKITLNAEGNKVHKHTITNT